MTTTIGNTPTTSPADQGRTRHVLRQSAGVLPHPAGKDSAPDELLAVQARGRGHVSRTAAAERHGAYRSRA